MALNWLNKFLKIVFWSFIVWLVVKVFIFQVFKVPTASMNATLKEGDYVLVNKLAYGARIPITPFSVHFAGERYFLDAIQLPYLRLPGYTDIKRNAIVVFNLPTENTLPVDERKAYVKRCLGLPGEILSIKQGGVYVQGIKDCIAPTPGQMNLYSVRHKEQSVNELYLSYEAFGNIYKSDSIEQMAVKTLPVGDYAPTYFPNAPQIKWNPDNLGPLYIPKKGQKIALNRTTLLIYQRVIEIYEGNTVSFKNDSILINGKPELYYTFTMDYYFMMGDNRNNSIDSRFWGFVSEDHVIGVVF